MITARSHPYEYGLWRRLWPRLCVAWRKSFRTFVEQVGRRPVAGARLVLRRGRRRFAPGSCYWQVPNRGLTRMITHRGKTMRLSEWARQRGIKRQTLARRLDAGWSVKRALEEPPRKQPASGWRRGLVGDDGQIVLEHAGKRQNLAAWARTLGISDSALRYRIRKWGLERALRTGRRVA